MKVVQLLIQMKSMSITDNVGVDPFHVQFPEILPSHGCIINCVEVFEGVRATSKKICCQNLNEVPITDMFHDDSIGVLSSILRAGAAPLSFLMLLVALGVLLDGYLPYR